MYDFIVLSSDELLMHGYYSDHSIVLNWEDRNPTPAVHYEVERYQGSEGYLALGTVAGGGITVFADTQPRQSGNSYRIRAIRENGSVYYSGVVTVAIKEEELESVYLASSSQPAGGMTLVINAGGTCQADVLLYSISGQRVWDRQVLLDKGQNIIDINNGTPLKGSIQVLFLIIRGRVAYSKKIVF